MFNKYYAFFKKNIKENLFYIITIIVFLVITFYPLDYYIFTGGGISNIDSRIKVENGYKTNGSYNLSYVTQVKGNIINYLLSYVMPNWERDKVSDYKYDESDNLEDLKFRDDLDLKQANANAVKTAYILAGSDYKLKSRSFYVISIYSRDGNNFKVGDKLLELDNKKINSLEDVKNIINISSKDYLDATVLRDKREVHFKAKLYNYKKRKVIGVIVNELDSYSVNPKVKIKFNSNESGPSAGFMTTLFIYDSLTKYDYTRGLKIAGTGTISSNGYVGPIGGVKYKLLGAVNSHADIFFVPSGNNYKEAVKIKKKRKLKIKIVKVEKAEDAINYLKKYSK